MARILVVDDEPQIVRALRINLRARGHEVVTAASGAEALAAAAGSRPDVVILDLGLPDLEGVEVIRRLRGWSDVPIIVLSGRTDSTDKIEALDAGADDYVTKPFDVEELLARTRSIARRAVDPAPDTPVRIGQVVVDLANRLVTTGVEPAAVAAVRLTPTEWSLLEVLLAHPGRLVTQKYLLQEVWGPGYSEETNYVRQYIAQLRRKLEPDNDPPRHFLTEPGMGYRFAP